MRHGPTRIINKMKCTVLNILWTSLYKYEMVTYSRVDSVRFVVYFVVSQIHE